MASPSDSTADDGTRKNLEQITFRFCSECSNMLYPKEDQDSHKLQFTCRTCQYTEEATSTCVFRNLMNNAVGETAGVTQDVGSDPTVSIPFLDASASEASQTGTSIDTSGSSADTSGKPLDTVSNAAVDRSAVVAVDDVASLADGDATPGEKSHTCLMDLEVERAVHSVTVTSVYDCLGHEEQSAWDNILVSNLASDMEFGLAGYGDIPFLTTGCGYGSYGDDDTDPPEAMGVEPEDVGGLELYL